MSKKRVDFDYKIKKFEFDYKICSESKPDLQKIFIDLCIQIAKGEYDFYNVRTKKVEERLIELDKAIVINAVVNYLCYRFLLDSNDSLYLQLFDVIIKPKKEVSLSNVSMIDLAGLISPETIKTM